MGIISQKEPIHKDDENFSSENIIFSRSNYYVNLLDHNNLYKYNGESWINQNISSYIFYNIENETTNLINAGKGNKTNICLKVISGNLILKLEGDSDIAPRNNYAINTYILYATGKNLDNLIYNIWISNGYSGGFPIDTQTSPFIFKANNTGSVYKCLPTDDNKILVNEINGGSKINNAILLKYTDAGFNENNNPSNLIEPSLETITQTFTNETGNQVIGDTILQTAISPMLLSRNDIFTITNKRIICNTDLIGDGQIISTVLRYWLDGQIVFKILIVNRTLRVYNEISESTFIAGTTFIANIFLNGSKKYSKHDYEITFEYLNGLTQPSSTYPPLIKESLVGIITNSINIKPHKILFDKITTGFIVDTTVIQEGTEGSFVFSITDPETSVKTVNLINLIKVPYKQVTLSTNYRLPFLKYDNKSTTIKIVDIKSNNILSCNIPTDQDLKVISISPSKLIQDNTNTVREDIVIDATSFSTGETGTITISWEEYNNEYEFISSILYTCIINITKPIIPSAVFYSVLSTTKLKPSGTNISIPLKGTIKEGMGVEADISFVWSGTHNVVFDSLYIAPLSGLYSFSIILGYEYVSNIRINMINGKPNIPFITVKNNTSETILYSGRVYNYNIKDGSTSSLGFITGAIIMNFMSYLVSGDCIQLYYNDNNNTANIILSPTDSTSSIMVIYHN